MGIEWKQIELYIFDDMVTMNITKDVFSWKAALAKPTRISPPLSSKHEREMFVEKLREHLYEIYSKQYSVSVSSKEDKNLAYFATLKFDLKKGF